MPFEYLGNIIDGVGSFLGSTIQGNRAKAEAQRNRNWQEEMSNTSYQRQAEDLKAANLNPILG